MDYRHEQDAIASRGQQRKEGRKRGERVPLSFSFSPLRWVNKKKDFMVEVLFSHLSFLISDL